MESFVYRPDGTPLELLYTAGGVTSRYWYEVDGLGSVVALTDATGNAVDQYQYDAWGAPAAPGSNGNQESVPQPLWYRGYLYDRELQTPGTGAGWYWLSVRSYDPTLERFIQPDPSEQDGTRSYVYCGDDPLDCSDPSGLWPSWQQVLTGLGVAAIVGVSVAAFVGTGGLSGLAEAAGFGAGATEVALAGGGFVDAATGASLAGLGGFGDVTAGSGLPALGGFLEAAGTQTGQARLRRLLGDLP
jgi:RHS repeat-associated protein